MQNIANKNIDDLLKIISVKLLNSVHSYNVGLANGKMGLAVYLYNYSRFSGDIRFNHAADQLLLSILRSVKFISSVSFRDGLAGIGAAIEYLMQEDFIQGERNSILEDIDKKLSGAITSQSSSNIISIENLTGLGKYFAARINGDKNGTIESDPDHRNCISGIVDSLISPYNTYEDLLNVIDFLPDAITLNINKVKALNFFDYALNKLETMLYEDNYFKISPIRYNSPKTALILKTACQRIDDRKYDNEYARILSLLKKQKMEDYCLTSSLSQIEFTKQLFISETIRLQQVNDFVDSSSQQTSEEQSADIGLASGLSGLGMAALFYSGRITKEWLIKLRAY